MALVRGHKHGHGLEQLASWMLGASLLLMPFMAFAQQECAEKQNEANIAERATHGIFVLPSAKKRAADTKADYDACVAAVHKRQADYAAQLQTTRDDRQQYKHDHAPSIVMGFSGRMLPRDPSLDPAGLYSPDPVFDTAAAHGWFELEDTTDARLWMAYMRDARQPHVALIALKQAEKGINHGFTGITILSGQVMCGADGSAPNYAHIVTAFKYAANGAPLAADGPVDTLPLTPGSSFALAVQQACKHYDK